MSPAQHPKISNARQAERAVLDWMRRRGYADAAPAVDGPEGIDVVAYSGLAQVRYGDAAVRRSELLKLEAAREGRPGVALFAVTTSSFDLPARTYADAKDIILLELTPDGHLEPLNTSAQLLLGGTARTSGTSGSPGSSLLPVLKHLPLLAAGYFLVVAAVQGRALATGGEGAPTLWPVLVSALLGLGFLAVWAFGTRRLGTDRSGDPGRGR